MSLSNYRLFSFYNKNVSPRVPIYQSAVFKKFGYPIEYVTDDNFDHGDFLNHVTRNITDTEFLIIFDVDCIPVNKNWIENLLTDLREPNTVAGAAQTANHLTEGKNLYVSPFFFGISTAYLKELNYPDMRMTETMDAGQNLTAAVLNSGGIVKYWWPTAIEEEKWDLYHPEHQKFGPGTTYNNSIYHAFFSRFDESDRFVKKCRSILTYFDRMRFIKLPRTMKKINRLFS